MSRSTKWKLAIVAGISECFVYAEAKYCAFEIHGEPKYYVCPRTEYCCNFGCCVSPGFQIYHLWYYWLLIIIMFLVCSGGGWWYRYWLQGRYRASSSAIPTRSSNSRTPNPLRGPTCQAQQARITYNTARNTVLLHRMWKGPHRGATSPAYSGAGAASSAAHYQNTSVVLNDANCPYYQLYGPPPSYETVIAQSRGKLSRPTSPELQAARAAGCMRPAVRSLQPPPPPAPADAAGYVGPCYYGVQAQPPRLHPALEVPQYQPPPPPPLPGFDGAEYARLAQHYGPPMSPRHQIQQQQQQQQMAAYERASVMSTSRSSDTSDAENSGTNCSRTDSPDDDGGFASARPDCVGSSCTFERLLQCYTPAGKFVSRVGIHGQGRRERGKYGSAGSSQSELASEPVATTSTSLGFEGWPAPSSSASFQRVPSRSEARKIQGGSLRIPRRREHQQQQQQQAAKQCEPGLAAGRRLSSAEAPPRPDPQSSPSSNVILAAAATSKCDADHDDQPNDRHQRHSQQQQQQQQQQQAPAIAERSSTNSNLESKRKLDRSRSLE